MKYKLVLAMLAAMAAVTPVRAEYMAHWANIRDENYDIIGQADAGDWADVYGTWDVDPSRSWVLVNGIYGTVSTVYIYGGTQEEYLDPWSYQGGGYDDEADTWDEVTLDEHQWRPMDLDNYAEPLVEDTMSYSGYGYYSIEIDTSSQTLYVYCDGALVLSTPVTTGKDSTPTPTGKFSILSKSTDQTLVGADYSAHVDYWLPIYGGVGIHDASWRGGFGGSDYHTDGSHGCINVDPDIMPVIYDLVQEGADVSIY